MTFYIFSEPNFLKVQANMPFYPLRLNHQDLGE